MTVILNFFSFIHDSWTHHKIFGLLWKKRCTGQWSECMYGLETAAVMNGHAPSYIYDVCNFCFQRDLLAKFISLKTA